MAAHSVGSSGNCSSCQVETNDSEVLQCYDCQTYYHGICNNQTPYCNKTFLSSFKKLKGSNFIFVCDICITKRENQEASSLKDQISELTATVNTLANEFKSFKEEKQESVTVARNETDTPSWSNPLRVQRMKSSLCIKSNGTPVNMEKVQELAANNSIQVSKTVVKENGDVYVDLPSKENREKLTPLLDDAAFTGNEVVTLKSRLPTVSILSVKEFTNKDNFIDKVKKQNPRIKERIDAGSEFSIVFCKKATNPQNDDTDANKYFQVVVRVSEDIRRAIKMNSDKIYIDLIAHRVVDRFYIKRCNKCQKFGHYEKDCQFEACCGYCRQPHLSSECQEVQEGDYEHYNCVNCKESGKKSLGHSSHWYNCPTYLELQRKMKNSIPFYQKNVR